jgi:hypothetical protein
MSDLYEDDIRVYSFDNDDRDFADFFEEAKACIPGYFIAKDRIQKIIKTFRAKRITAFVEKEYIDKQYRDSYYLYYTQKIDNTKRNCVRIVFF